MLLKLRPYYRSMCKYSYDVGQIIKDGPELIYPLIWRNAVDIAEPSSNLVETLTREERKRLDFIRKEADIFSRLSPLFPQKFDDEAWQFLLNCETRKQRLDHIIFLGKRENLRKREGDKRKKRQEEEIIEQREPLSENQLVYWMTSRVEKDEKTEMQLRVARAHILNDRPSLAVDCRFLEKMSPRAAQLTGAQLQYVVSNNLSKKDPWPLYFVNFDINAPSTSSVIKRHLGNLENSRSCTPVITPFNYTAIFPRKKIIYLSPHAEEELTDLQEEDVLYIMGGIVDRVTEKGIHPQASRIAAEEDEIRCAKFPLDRFIEWKSGTKYLTLVAVANILHTVHRTGGDWKLALSENIPVRNKRGPEEKSRNIIDKYEKRREFNRQILEVTNKELPEIG